MITIKTKGDFRHTEKFLTNAKRLDVHRLLEKYGREGVGILSSATPQDTGVTAASWDYKFEAGKTSGSITWINTNVENGISVVILIQYGHATRGGTYIQGVDFINPAIRPIFDKFTQDLCKEVLNL